MVGLPDLLSIQGIQVISLHDNLLSLTRFNVLLVCRTGLCPGECDREVLAWARVAVKRPLAPDRSAGTAAIPWGCLARRRGPVAETGIYYRIFITWVKEVGGVASTRSRGAWNSHAGDRWFSRRIGTLTSNWIRTTVETRVRVWLKEPDGSDHSFGRGHGSPRRISPPMHHLRRG